MSERIKALQDAGMVFPTPIGDEVRNNVDGLTEEEFQSLLALTRKIGEPGPGGVETQLKIEVGTGFQTKAGGI